ncbi:aminoglycoside phosphotransferase family protein [Actinacidiphila paucisporea]|uniref:Phosphotransferase enzyme family protein n=1 Tax=Actinacidiphila paucisporea TaxID=310782 RepID=A0A1M6U7B5_9ACTN|nr:aminoglycoside phosphotransferase family protein [Actinacidiphila paucisporea]SHK65060.1 Phosphotransferase enzyme family protein [Actinacidiphila paucisporea]
MRLPFGDGLRDALGPPRRARRLGSSPRSRVWRVELGAGPAVVKQIVGGDDAGERYAREVAALRLALRAETPVVPALLGTDADARVMVLEHVGHRRPPAGWTVDYATALARLHASAGPEVTGILPRWQGPDASDTGAFLGLADRLGVPVPPGVPAELDALTDRLAEAPGHALLHGDPCPGNDLHTADGVRFIDFEHASWGSGLVELAYLRIGFPTCWCVTAAPEALLERAERAYLATWRAETGTDLPGLSAGLSPGPSTGPGLGTAPALADACAGWLVRGDALVERAHRDGTDHLSRLPAEDWTWGTVTARERLAHRLAVVGRLTAGHPDLSGLSTLAAAFRERMLTRWPTLGPAPAARP